MGYELYMKVGRVSEIAALQNEQGQHYFREDCSIDMSKCGESNVGNLASDYMTKGKALLYWYENDKEVTEDACGDKPKPIPTKLVIEALRKDVKVLDHGDNDRPYRRFEWRCLCSKPLKREMTEKRKSFA